MPDWLRIILTVLAVVAWVRAVLTFVRTPRLVRERIGDSPESDRAGIVSEGKRTMFVSVLWFAFLGWAGALQVPEYTGPASVLAAVGAAAAFALAAAVPTWITLSIGTHAMGFWSTASASGTDAGTDSSAGSGDQR